MGPIYYIEIRLHSLWWMRYAPQMAPIIFGTGSVVVPAVEIPVPRGLGNPLPLMHPTMPGANPFAVDTTVSHAIGVGGAARHIAVNAHVFAGVGAERAIALHPLARKPWRGGVTIDPRDLIAQCADQGPTAAAPAPASGAGGMGTAYCLAAVMAQESVTADWDSKKMDWAYAVLKRLEPHFGQQDDWPTEVNDIFRFLGTMYDRLSQDGRQQQLALLDAGDERTLRHYWYGIHQSEAEMEAVTAGTAELQLADIEAALEAEHQTLRGLTATVFSMRATHGMAWEVMRATSRPAIRDAIVRDGGEIVRWGKAHLGRFFPVDRYGDDPQFFFTVVLNHLFNRIKAAGQIVDLLDEIFRQEAAERKKYDDPDITRSMSEIYTTLSTRLHGLIERAPAGIHAQHHVSYALMAREAHEMVQAVSVNPLHTLAAGFRALIEVLNNDDMPPTYRMAIGEALGIGPSDWNAVMQHMQGNTLYAYAMAYGDRAPYSEAREVENYREVHALTSSGRSHGTILSLRATNQRYPEWVDAMERAWPQVWLPAAHRPSGSGPATPTPRVIDRRVVTWSEAYLRPRYQLPAIRDVDSVVADPKNTARYLSYAGRAVFLHLQGLQLVADLISQVYDSSLSADALLGKIQDTLHELEATPPLGLSWQARAQYKMLARWTLGMLRRKSRQALTEVAEEYYQVVTLLGRPDIPPAYRTFVQTAYGVGNLSWDNFDVMLRSNPLFQAAKLINGKNGLTQLRQQIGAKTGAAREQTVKTFERLRTDYLAAVDAWAKLAENPADEARFSMVYALLRESPTRMKLVATAG